MAKLRIVFIILAIVLIVVAGVLAIFLISGADSGSVSPQAGVASIEGSSDSLVGSWKGSSSLFFGMATADYTLEVRPDGTMTIAGIADAPIAGIEKLPFSADATWEHRGGTTYMGTIGNKSMEFTCDGSQIFMTVNPYGAGLIDYEILNMDIDFALTRRV